MIPLKKRHITARLSSLLSIFGLATALHAADPIVIGDFESDNYGAWQAEGTAFGSGPAQGPLGGQQAISGFAGKGFANSFHGGDDSTGKLTSPEFKIEHKFISALIGGGNAPNQASLNLIVDGKIVRTTSGNDSENFEPVSWDVSEFAGKNAVLQIVDERKGGWGHILVDQIVQSDVSTVHNLVPLEKTLWVVGTHLLVPVSNVGGSKNSIPLGIYDGDKLVQSFTVTLPKGDEPFWLAAYPLESFGLKGKQITIKPAQGKSKFPESFTAGFDRIKTGCDKDALVAADYTQPYRNQFHASTRRGWVNDPNGMVFHNGKYHLYYQHNPFGIQWGNMHWGHLESSDLIHWVEKPIALFQKTLKDMAFSGNGFVDFNNSAGLGKDTQFGAYTSTGRGECIVYSKDGGLTFNEIPENPVIKHTGRDPFVFWYEPEQKWVMALYDETPCDETKAVPPDAKFEKNASRNIAFYESKNLRQWTRTGAFTDPDRAAVFECPGFFQLTVAGKPGESRWILLGAQNRYFIGQFDGKTFKKEAGPLGTNHGTFYAAETFNDVPDGRRIQIGWVQTDTFLNRFPDQISNQAFTLPHEMTLRETPEGLLVFFWPVKETEKLRGDVLAEGQDLTIAQANEMLQKCNAELTEVLIEFANEGNKSIVINGIDASFNGRSARIFADRTFNEIYANDGLSYEVRKLTTAKLDARQSQINSNDSSTVRSLKIYRLNSIWNKNAH